MPPRVSLTAGGERGSEAFTGARATETALAQAQVCGNAARSAAPQRRRGARGNTSPSSPGRCRQVAGLRASWAAGRTSWRGLNVRRGWSRGSGVLEGRKVLGAGWGRPHCLVWRPCTSTGPSQAQRTTSRPDAHESCETRNCPALSQIHPQPQKPSPAFLETLIPSAYMALSTSAITGCFIFTVIAAAKEDVHVVRHGEIEGSPGLCRCRSSTAAATLCWCHPSGKPGQATAFDIPPAYPSSHKYDQRQLPPAPAHAEPPHQAPRRPPRYLWWLR